MVILAAAFAIIVVNYFSEVRSDRFPDRDLYLEKIPSLISLDDKYDIPTDNVFRILFSEIGWRYLLISVGLHFDDFERGLNLISFVTLFIFTLFCIQYRKPRYITFIFLLNPIVIDLVMSQQRSAFAMAVFMTGLMLSRLTGKRALLLVGGLTAQSIHFTFIIFFAIYMLAQYLSTKFLSYNFNVRKIFAVGCGILLSLSILFSRTMLYNLSDNYKFVLDYGSSTVLSSFFWFCLLLALIVLSKRKAVRSWQYCYAIVLLTLFIIFTLSNFYNTRFLALSFPIILNSLRDTTKSAQPLLYAGLLIYQCALYSYWL